MAARSLPDYRDSLTFAELVDLVAYLKNLGGGERVITTTRPTHPRSRRPAVPCPA